MERPRISSIVQKFGLLESPDLRPKTSSHEASHAAQEHLLVGSIPVNAKPAIVTAEQVFASSLMDHGNIATIIDDDKATT